MWRRRRQIEEKGLPARGRRIQMKATGIVRRIDDLGRVVIPKEIRRTMRIREGDPLEIFTDREGEVIFKKYSPIGELSGFASQYAETIWKTSGVAVVICDRDAVTACAGVPKKEYLDRKMSEMFEKILEGRGLYIYRGDDPVYVIRESGAHFVGCAMPITANGDAIGCVAALHPTEELERFAGPSDVEQKLISTAACFLGRQMEE